MTVIDVISNVGVWVVPNLTLTIPYPSPARGTHPLPSPTWS